MDMVLSEAGPPQRWWRPSQLEKTLAKSATPYVCDALPPVQEQVPTGMDRAANTPANGSVQSEKTMNVATHGLVLSTDADFVAVCERHDFGCQDVCDRRDDVFDSTPLQTDSSTMTHHLTTPKCLGHNANIHQRDMALPLSEGTRLPQTMLGVLPSSVPTSRQPSSLNPIGLMDEMSAEVFEPSNVSTCDAQLESGREHADASKFHPVCDPSPQACQPDPPPIRHPFADASAVLQMGYRAHAPFHSNATQNVTCWPGSLAMSAMPQDRLDHQGHFRVVSVTTEMMSMTYGEFLAIAKASAHRVHALHVSLFRSMIDVCVGVPLDVAANNRFVPPDDLLNVIHSLHAASPIDVFQWLCEDPADQSCEPPRTDTLVDIIDMPSFDDFSAPKPQCSAPYAWREHVRTSSHTLSRSTRAENPVENNAALPAGFAASGKYKTDDVLVSTCPQSPNPRDATLPPAVEVPEEEKPKSPARARPLPQRPQRAPDSPRAATYRIFQNQLVDPHTGQPVASSTPDAITRRLFLSRRLVDPLTGRPVAAGTPGAISRTAFDKKKLVDPQTRQRVAAGTPGAITVNALSRRRPVDPQTGERVPMGTPGAIRASLFQDRKPVDPQTGLPVPAGTPGAITKRKFHSQKPVDPRTGKDVPRGTPGAITAAQFQRRKYVDPQTGCRVGKKAPGATLKTGLSERQLVDLQTAVDRSAGK